MPLELVHTDVCYVDTKSHASSQYFVTFIDDYSRKLWVSVLKAKDQELSVFKEFQVRAKRETGRKLKTVRSDNGREYRVQFEEYYQALAIWLEYTVPKTPRLNGLGKRMNRTEVCFHMLSYLRCSGVRH